MQSNKIYKSFSMKSKKSLIILLSWIIFASPSIIAQDVVKLTTSKAAGETVNLQLNQLRKGATIDWGDGTAVSISPTDDDLLTITGSVQGEGNITLSTSSKIRTFICSNNSLTSLDVSGATNLLSLYCQDNELTTLDVSKCTKLTDLNCARNQISKIKITASTNPTLENINIAANGLSSNTGSGTGFTLANTDLQHIDISDNNFSSVTFNTKNKNIDEFKCRNNNIKKLSLSVPTDLTTLLADGNQISSLTLNADGLPSLRYIFIDDNNLTGIDLSASTELQYLSVANNALTTMTLPSRKKLYAISCANNNLTGASLPTTNYKPTNFSYLPQDLIIDISSKLKKSDAGSYYITLCPSYNDRNEEDYLLDLTDWAKDTDGNRVTFGFYGCNGTDDYAELTKASTSNKEGDYFPLSTNANFGKISFLKNFDHVYITLTAKSYPDLVSQTTGFKVTDSTTGISQINTVDGLQISSSLGMLHLTSDKATSVSIYSIEGKLTWKGIIDDSPVSVQLPEGVYLVNGHKVIL